MPNGLDLSAHLKHLLGTALLAGCLVSLPLDLRSQSETVQDDDEDSYFVEAPSLEVAESLLNSGQYEEVIEYASTGQELDPWVGDWELFKARALMALGQYETAFTSLGDHLSSRRYDLRVRFLYREAALRTGRSEEAVRQLENMAFLVNEYSDRYGYDPEDIVTVGRIALLFQMEPKLVLENFFQRAQGFRSKPASAFLAAGNLALSKDDFKLASKSFQEGLQEHPENVELLHGLASSFKQGDRSQLFEYATQALQINPRHVPTQVLLAENYLSAEAYDVAEDQLNLAIKTNPASPDALALKATLSYIRNDVEQGDEWRELALSSWPTNPEVDYVIGYQLSRKYRFSDGERHQRAALELDPSFNPARIQLAQDLLRLGRNEEAWTYADAVHESDPYNISAYNLATLRDRLQEFTNVESEHFLVRLTPDEAAVYGDRAIRVLENAHARLTERYGVTLPQKTTVEIYPNPADFETRTFGMPGNPGYLGVCFGPVFTINSPATRSANWEAVLYHEFCHTVTLNLTNNRMPRWLSEGISVYEEQIENPAWGQRMTASYRNRILSDKMQPISSMSAAFLQAESGEDIQFAYFQSYLVVEYLIQEYGLEAMKALLLNLGDGEPISESLAIHFAPLETLDAQFSEYAKGVAEELAPGFRFESSSGPMGAMLDRLSPQENYHELLAEGQNKLAAENWTEAIAIFQDLVAKAGYLPGEENAHLPLAKSYREIGEEDKEAAVLREMYGSEANRLAPVRRLLEIAKSTGKADDIRHWSEAWIAINPMAETPWRALLNSSKELSRNGLAREAAAALLALDLPDKPALHFQLAQLARHDDLGDAKLHVLKALEDAPRFKDAHVLLREIQTELSKKENGELLRRLDLDNEFFN